MGMPLNGMIRHNWRDDRPKLRTRPLRVKKLIDHALAVSSAARDMNGKLETSILFDAIMHKVVPAFDGKFCDLPFVGMSQDVQAFFDASRGNHVRIRSCHEVSIYGDAVNGEERRSSKNILTHDLGHPLSGHRETLIKRNPRVATGTHMRLAHNARALRGRADWVRGYSGVLHGDLEEEADIVMLALQVPITQLDEFLELPVNRAVPLIQEKYDVCDWVAYNAALLNKDYRRIEQVRSTN